MKERICKNCDNLKMVYRANSMFEPIYHKRICTKHNKIMQFQDTCDCWCKKKVKYDLSEERFEEIFEQLQYMLAHIEEIEQKEIEQWRIERKIRRKDIAEFKESIAKNNSIK